MKKQSVLQLYGIDSKNIFSVVFFGTIMIKTSEIQFLKIKTKKFI